MRKDAERTWTTHHCMRCGLLVFMVILITLSALEMTTPWMYQYVSSLHPITALPAKTDLVPIVSSGSNITTACYTDVLLYLWKTEVCRRCNTTVFGSKSGSEGERTCEPIELDTVDLDPQAMKILPILSIVRCVLIGLLSLSNINWLLPRREYTIKLMIKFTRANGLRIFKWKFIWSLLLLAGHMACGIVALVLLKEYCHICFKGQKFIIYWGGDAVVYSTMISGCLLFSLAVVFAVFYCSTHAPELSR